MRISDWSSDVCSSDLVAIDGKSAAALQPKEEQRFAAKCRAEDQHHADRQGFDQRKEQRVTTRCTEFGQSGPGHNRRAREAHKKAGKEPRLCSIPALHPFAPLTQVSRTARERSACSREGREDGSQGASRWGPLPYKKTKKKKNQ